MKDIFGMRLKLADTSQLFLEKLGREKLVAITQNDSSGPQTIVLDREMAALVMAFLAVEHDIIV